MKKRSYIRRTLAAASAPLLLTFGYVYITGTAGIATAYAVGGKVVAVGADLGWAAATYGWAAIKGAADVIAMIGAVGQIRRWKWGKKPEEKAAAEVVS